VLSELPARSQHGSLRAVVESPRGSTVKLRFDPDLRAFALARLLPLGLSYPFDWGFVPGTLAADGDPIDIVVFNDRPSWPGLVLPCRALAVLELTQRSPTGKRIRNDRIVAMLDLGERHGQPQRLAWSRALERELERFFLDTTFFTDKRQRVLGWGRARKAAQSIDEGVRAFERARSDRAATKRGT